MHIMKGMEIPPFRHPDDPEPGDDRGPITNNWPPAGRVTVECGGVVYEETSSMFSRDERDMRRMGIEQKTERRFGLITMLGFTSTLMSTWESTIVFFVVALTNGGGITMTYGFIVAFIGALATSASLAEMASMYPVSGGQYHWVALLAPPKYARFLSWLTGWLSALGWQAATSNGTYFSGVAIQAMISLNHPDYVAERWHAVLLLYAIILVALSANTVLIKLLPGFEGIVLILQIIGITGILIPVVYFGEISSNEFVWKTFTDYSGYNNPGLSWLIGQSATSLLFIGYDGACHMAEEVRNASINVPRAMMLTITLNGILGFGTSIFILYCIGDPEKVINTKYGAPFVEIFYSATGSKTGTTAMTSLLIAMFISATIAFLASASRQAWAFSRDEGLPFSSFIKQVNPKLSIPIWSIVLTCTISALLGLINLGSNVAFNAITTLVVAGFFSSYVIAILAMISKRLRGEKINFGPWTLGRWGLPINIFAVIYTFLMIVFSFFPASVPVTNETMNWSCVVYAGVVILGILYYAVSGRHNYSGPLPEKDLAALLE